LRRIQRQIALWLKPFTSTQAECVTAYRKGGSALKNAQVHAGRSVVIVADLKDFFGSISLLDVVALFEQLGADRQVAVVLARLTTLEEKLVPGARTSPAIANLVASRLDDLILGKLPKGCRYTRYADDLTISGPNTRVPSLPDLRAWIESTGFRVREGSLLRTMKKAGPYVTGLHVGGKIPAAPRRIRRSVERFLRFAEKFDLASTAQETFKSGPRATDPRKALRYVRGIAMWMKPIDEALAGKWIERIDALQRVQVKGLAAV
jgi:hypothetical protein